MVYHPGKVVEVFPKKGKADAAQAMIEFWDENLSIVRLDAQIEGAVRQGDTVLVDYYPSSEKPHNPKLVAVKVVDRKKSDAVWKKYKQHHSRLKQMQSLVAPVQQHNIGVG
jgi:hypothetical protein